MHGIPEEISTDGGPTYMAYETQKFLADYGVRHRVSSVAYPHSNQRAELAVKSMKRLCRENTCSDGSLNSDKFLRAVMAYRNTPDRDTGRSPAQVIFGRELRDFLPAPLMRYKPQPQWIMMRDDREKALRKRALKNMEKLAVGTKQLLELKVHDIVQVQNQVGNHPSRWDITGTIVEVKPFDQYVVKVHGSGRLTARNRKFLRRVTPYAQENTPPVTVHGPQSGQSPGGHVQNEYLVPAEASDEQHVDEPAREPLVVEEDSTPPVEAAVPPVEIRRSSRSRREPDRLEVDWGGKSYEKKLIVPPQDCMTASHSLDYSDCLYPARPGGGEGIYGDGSVSNLCIDKRRRVEQQQR